MRENATSGEIIGAAIAVHTELGRGLLESVYEEALVIELGFRGRPVSRQAQIPLAYKGILLNNVLRILCASAVGVGFSKG